MREVCIGLSDIYISSAGELNSDFLCYSGRIYYILIGQKQNKICDASTFNHGVGSLRLEVVHTFNAQRAFHFLSYIYFGSSPTEGELLFIWNSLSGIRYYGLEESVRARDKDGCEFES